MILLNAWFRVFLWAFRVGESVFVIINLFVLLYYDFYAGDGLRFWTSCFSEASLSEDGSCFSRGSLLSVCIG